MEDPLLCGNFLVEKPSFSGSQILILINACVCVPQFKYTSPRGLEQILEWGVCCRKIKIQKRNVFLGFKCSTNSSKDRLCRFGMVRGIVPPPYLHPQAGITNIELGGFIFDSHLLESGKNFDKNVGLWKKNSMTYKHTYDIYDIYICINVKSCWTGENYTIWRASNRDGLISSINYLLSKANHVPSISFPRESCPLGGGGA